MMDDSLLGKQLDEYRLEALLGKGGMARVYRGLDTRLQRYVAIKVIDTPLRTDAEYARRFEREGQAIAKLEHPGIVRLYRYGEAEGMLYMAMQYVEGADLGFVLATYREDQEFIEPEDASRIIRDVCLALDYAHSKGVIHRDVKPSNIMLNKQGRAILTDFGLVLLTEVGTRGEIFGSPHYIAPEQAISSAGAVPQSDLYSVGIILYEMFTGVFPFDAENSMDIALLQMTSQPHPPRELRSDLSLELERMILKALAKEPADRYPTGVALADALDQALKHASATASAPFSTTVPRPSIPERVAMELAEHPLPPVPAAVETPRSSQTQARPVPAPPPLFPTTFQTKKRRFVYAGAGAGLAVVLVLLMAVLFLLLSDKDEESDTDVAPAIDNTLLAAKNTATETVGSSTAVAAQLETPTSTLPLVHTATISMTPSLTATRTATATMTPTHTHTPTATLTVAPTLTPSPVPPTPIPPTATPIAVAENATGSSLFIARHDDESLFVVNLTTDAFPLAPLRLGDGDGTITGAEWGIGMLAPGECVAVWDDKDDSEPPDVTCNEVGAHLTRKGKERFWKSSFSVYYGGEWVANCDADQCSVSILDTEPPDVVVATTGEFELLIARRGEDSLFIVNLTEDRAFPLAELSLGDDKGTIAGTEWGIAMLATGDCVTAWKDSGKPKPPDVTCNEVGPHLTRKGKERFWKSAFSVYYDGELIDDCDAERCFVTIPG